MPLHPEVVHECFHGLVARQVDAADLSQFCRDLRPVPARVIAAPGADDLSRADAGRVKLARGDFS
jgi:hypothetical protein